MKDKNLHKIFEQTNCLSRQDMLAYLEGNYSPKEQYHFEKHLNTCSSCRDEFEGFVAMQDNKRLPVIVDELNQRMDNYLYHSNTKSPFLKKLHPLRIAATILILIGSGFFINYYLQYSSKEYSDQEMVSQSIEEPVSNKSELFAEDGFSEPVAKKIKSANEKIQTNKDNNKNDHAKNRDKLSTGEKSDNMIALTDVTEDDAADFELDEEFKTVMSDDKIKEEPSLVAESLGEGVSENKNITAKKLVPEETELEKEEEVSYVDRTIENERKDEINVNKTKLLSNKKGKTKGYQIVSYLQTGVDAFHNGNYTEAVESLKKSEMHEGEADKTTYYLGLSYSRLGNLKKALLQLNKLVNDPINEYQNDAMWEKALLLIRIGKRKSAINVFNDLIKTGPPYKNDAQQKLDSLLNN
ncbi:MAG: zf-HC2 domain-containing protein [Bacteroidota bacterium]